MKTVTIPEQVIKPLIDNLCKREGTISKLVDQSGLGPLNIVLLMSGQMPDITESLKGSSTMRLIHLVSTTLFLR